MASTSKSVLNKFNINHYATDSYFDEKGIQYLKTDYYNKLEEYITRLVAKEGNNVLIWNRDVLNNCVRLIKEGGSNSITITGLGDYEVVTINGREGLVKKREGDLGVQKTVVPYDDSFKLVWEAHKYLGHCNEPQLLQYLLLKCEINKFVAKAMTDVCYVCKTAGKRNVRCVAYIVKPLPHIEFCSEAILVYEDIANKFVQLRPISIEAHELDIALELFKLFTDFGPPANLEVLEPIFLPAIDYLKSLLSDVDVKFRLVEMETDKNKVTSYKERIATWMKENTKNLSIGCHVVQWEINNSKFETETTTPHQKVFSPTANTVTSDTSECQDPVEPIPEPICLDSDEEES